MNVSISLKLAARSTLIALINQQRGGAADMYRYFKIIEKLEITPEEMDAIGLKVKDGQMYWDADKDQPKDIELNTQQYEQLKALISSSTSLSPTKHTVELIEAFKLNTD